MGEKDKKEGGGERVSEGGRREVVGIEMDREGI